MENKYVPTTGDKRCLKCEKIFASKDIKKNWLCPSCTAKNLGVRGIKVTNPHLSGHRTHKPSSND